MRSSFPNVFDEKLTAVRAFMATPSTIISAIAASGVCPGLVRLASVFDLLVTVGTGVIGVERRATEYFLRLAVERDGVIGSSSNPIWECDQIAWAVSDARRSRCKPEESLKARIVSRNCAIWSTGNARGRHSTHLRPALGQPQVGQPKTSDAACYLASHLIVFWI